MSVLRGRKLSVFAFLLVGFAFIRPSETLAQEPKSLNGVALVIGQSEYEHITALPNPANDAREVVKLLTDLGFDARSVTDRDATRLKRDLERFVEDAEEADVALLYYSGHGIEAGGENWLIPVDADDASLTNASEALVPISEVMDQLKQTVPVAIMLLDACRTNPFPADAVVRRQPKASGEKIAAGGLAPVRSAVALSNTAPGTDNLAADNLGTVIGFAAEPGRPALDGTAGETSPYASALLRHLGAMQGNEFGSVMRMVTEEVYLDTKGEQRPWINESLRRLLYFGVALDEPTGDDSMITGERRQLLLTIADLPDAQRSQVELAAAKDDVPLDSLYGVLRALGTEKIPENPTELEKVLDAQADRLTKMLAERDALRTDDPEIVRLASAADTAIREGAITAARHFLDEAVARVEATSGAVDAAEDAVKEKRLADAAVYVKRADASSLAFDHAAAANDYGKAFGLVEKWDDKLAWNYKNMEAEALGAQGDNMGDSAALGRSLKAYEEILGMLPYGDKGEDWAITRNNMAIVLQTLGERDANDAQLLQAAEIFRESLAVFTETRDDVNWSAAQNNIGNVLLKLGQRKGDATQLTQAVDAFRATLDKRDRNKVPLDWAAAQNNIGIALFALSERDPDAARLTEAEAAYRAALEVYTREAAPVQWAMVQNNLGNTLNGLGSVRNDKAAHEAAAEAFRAALEIRTRDTFPIDWASSRLNLGNALTHITKFDLDTALLQEAIAAYGDASQVYTREQSPLDWASVQNNLGGAYQTLGQRTGDPAKMEESVAAFQAAAQVYTRDALPLDWAMTRYNAGNTLQLLGGLTSQPDRYREAATAYRESLEEYRRDIWPHQWALSQAGLAATLLWLANSEEGTQSLVESIEARRAALEVLTLENTPVDWANAQNGLGMALLNLSTRQSSGDHLAEATAAFEASLKVFTREAQPLQWAFGQNNLGDIQWNRGAMGGGLVNYALAIAYFDNAKQGFTEAGYLAPIAITDQKIELIRKAMAGK